MKFIGTRNSNFVIIAMMHGHPLYGARRPYIPYLGGTAGGHHRNVHWDTVKKLVAAKLIARVPQPNRLRPTYVLTPRGRNKYWSI